MSRADGNGGHTDAANPTRGGTDDGVHLLTNPVRHYAWGDRHVIPEFLGTEPDGRPWAELSIGGHPDDSSMLADGRTVGELVEHEPERVLGAVVRDRFGGRLPYLAKVLAAAEPLSIQVHPDPAQAARGFAAEEAAGIERDAPHRCYRDPYAKPEMVLALSRFEALCGIRPVAETLRVVDDLAVDHPRWPALTGLLRRSPDEAGARAYLEQVLGGGAWVGGLADALAAAARSLDTPTMHTLADLGRRYPGDPGVLVALLLHRVTLAPGEAMFLGAGVLHAYLQGAAVEVMGASDNVLRAGLTGKHVDGGELLALATLEPGPPGLLSPRTQGHVQAFAPPTPEFEVHVVRPAGTRVDPTPSGPRVVLVVDGEVLLHHDRGPALRLGRGQSVLVEAAAGSPALSGDGTAVVVAVPVAPED